MVWVVLVFGGIMLSLESVCQARPLGPLRVNLTIEFITSDWSMEPVLRLLVIAPVASLEAAREQRQAVSRALDIGFRTYRSCTIGAIDRRRALIRSAHLRLVDEDWVGPLPRGGYVHRTPRQVIRPTQSWQFKQRKKEVDEHFLNFFARIARALNLTLA